VGLYIGEFNMSALDGYPDVWAPGTPHTDQNATVCRFRHVENVRGARIKEGTYRGALVSGIFELYQPTLANPIKVQPSGKRKVEVICAWHGFVPNKNRGASIDISSSQSTVELLENFTGEVVDNIGSVTDPTPL
jgi:hypothetical protein